MVNEYWDINQECYTSSVTVGTFLNELFDLYEKHGLSIGHEDSHGAFIIEKLKDANVEWMQAASIDLR